MPALEPVEGLRVVAAPSALDAARWQGEAIDVLRIAPDEAFAIGATAAEIADPDAIVEPEPGFAVALLTDADVAAIAAHIEWALPNAPGTLGQGKIAGVPAKLLIGDPSILVTQSAYAAELRARLGW